MVSWSPMPARPVCRSCRSIPPSPRSPAIRRPRRSARTAAICKATTGCSRRSRTSSAALARREDVTVTLRNYRKDGTQFWNELQLAAVRDGRGALTHYVGIMRDVTRLQDATSRLQQAVQCDLLTGLANRLTFHEQLEEMLRQGDASRVLLLKLDVSGFHVINTSFGDETGDALLLQMAALLREIPEAVAGLSSWLAADEFALATRLADMSEADALVARLRARFAEPFTLPGTTLAVRVAIGYTLAQPGMTARALFQQAAIALRQSKASQPLEPCRFDAVSAALVRNRANLTVELSQAVAHRDFVLHYQPKVELVTGELVGAEALIRWAHPLFGLQPPGRFIPTAEETGMIVDIGALALRSAAAFACRLNADRDVPLSIAVNVSPVQFTHRDLEETLRRVLDETGADPRWLTLELTESVFAESSPEIIAVLRRIRDLGCGLAIDDFGTGYSSLRYLETFPLSEIKIDRSFVSGLDRSRFRSVVVDAVVKMGRALGAAVTAEGVETDADRLALLQIECPYAQGYAFGAPMPEEAFALVANEPAPRRPVLPRLAIG